MTAEIADRPVVLIVPELDESQLLTAVGCGAVAILPRALVSQERLVQSVLAAQAGAGMMPPHLVGRLLEHFRWLQREVLLPNGLTSSGLNSRELDVLRLMADGWGTAEIAEHMRYSVRNRSHVVPYALRTGLI